LQGLSKISKPASQQTAGGSLLVKRLPPLDVILGLDPRSHDIAG